MKSKESMLLTPVEALTKDFIVAHNSQPNSITFLNNRDMSSDLSDDAKEIIKRQGLRLGALNLMIRFEDGNQISELPKIFPLPNSPEWFKGMSNINGQTIPVFDLKSYFNLPLLKEDEIKHERDMLLVVEHDNNATGIIINGLLKRLDFDAKSAQDTVTAPNQLEGCVKASYLLEKEIWYDLDSLAFLDSLESSIKA